MSESDRKQRACASTYLTAFIRIALDALPKRVDLLFNELLDSIVVHARLYARPLQLSLSLYPARQGCRCPAYSALGRER